MTLEQLRPILQHQNTPSAVLTVLGVVGGAWTVAQLVEATGKHRVKIHEALRGFIESGVVTKSVHPNEEGVTNSVHPVTNSVQGYQLAVTNSVHPVTNSVQSSDDSVTNSLHPQAPDCNHLVTPCNEIGTPPVTNSLHLPQPEPASESTRELTRIFKEKELKHKEIKRGESVITQQFSRADVGEGTPPPQEIFKENPKSISRKNIEAADRVFALAGSELSVKLVEIRSISGRSENTFRAWLREWILPHSGRLNGSFQNALKAGIKAFHGSTSPGKYGLQDFAKAVESYVPPKTRAGPQSAEEIYDQIFSEIKEQGGNQ